MALAADETLRSLPGPDTRLPAATPRTSTSTSLYDEPALASSPILKSEHLMPSQKTDYLPPRKQKRASTTSSIRLSKDLGDLRWNGVEEPEAAEQEVQQDRIEEEPETSETKAPERQDGEQVDEVTYSALSKRAELILANAKKKLNVSARAG
jgi:hypothetical protein